jgi:NTP pyrophosphatase (non-canonical NTP hydrolase)
MDIAQLQQTLKQFAAERDWEQFHTPKNLAMALMVEVAELVEIFQWMTPEQSRIADEVADVLLYLLQLADHSAIDLKRAVGRKLVKNAKKHPPTKFGLPTGPVATLQVASHVLVDWENVQPKDVDIKALVPDVTHVWIFHGINQKKADANQGTFGENLTLVPIIRPGKNALDFHLSFYMGYITSRNPDARIVVISNDQGYAPMLGHAQDLGFATSQVGFGKPIVRAATTKVVAKKAPAKKATAKKAAAKKTTAQPQGKPATPTKKVAVKKAAAQVSVAKTAAVAASAARISDKVYAHVVNSLHKSKHKPTRETRLHSMVRSFIDGGKAEKDLVEQAVSRLVQEGYVVVDEKGGVTMAR